GAEAIQAVLTAWLNSNLQQFNHVFAAVDLNVTADNGAFQWLKPTKLGYAVNTEGADSSDDYVFGVLAMTSGRDDPNLSNQISSNIIPSGANAGFLVSQERYIDQIFMPGAYMLFNGATGADFDTTNDGTTITNTQPLAFQKFVLDDGSVISDATIGT